MLRHEGARARWLERRRAMRISQPILSGRRGRQARAEFSFGSQSKSIGARARSASVRPALIRSRSSARTRGVAERPEFLR